MEMDAAMEEEFSGSNDQMMIVKRKRTKRCSRQVSSLNAIVTSSSSSDDGGGGGGDEIRFLIPSNSMTSEISTSTEEDEDMANCLILLAQSGSSSTQQQMDQLEEVKIEKINSRRFNEMATTTGKAGIYVYECKTCNRSFPSFQALGGHRASHKKSKIAMVDEKKVSIVSTSSNDQHPEKEEEKQREAETFTKKICSSPNISIQLPNIIKGSSNNGIKKGGKIHECSICGTEFSSGQALGGHMRRHRNIPTSNKGNINIDTSTTTESSSHEAGDRRRNMLQLDLNLPAPVEDDHDSKFQFSTNQQKHVLFSSPAMVDCHY